MAAEVVGCRSETLRLGLDGECDDGQWGRDVGDDVGCAVAQADTNSDGHQS